MSAPRQKLSAGSGARLPISVRCRSADRPVNGPYPHANKGFRGGRGGSGANGLAVTGSVSPLFSTGYGWAGLAGGLLGPRQAPALDRAPDASRARWHNTRCNVKQAIFTTDNGKYKVTDPREGLPTSGVKTFDGKATAEAVAYFNQINGELAAEHEAALEAKRPKASIALLSVDGAEVNGISTRKATSNVVYKAKEKDGIPAHDVTEIDLCQTTGYVLVGFSGNGRVRNEWVVGADGGKPWPMTEAGIAALQGIFGAPAKS